MFLHNIALYTTGLYLHQQSHPQLVLFLLSLHLFILSGVISPLTSYSILGTYRPGEFMFQCPIFVPFHPGWAWPNQTTSLKRRSRGLRVPSQPLFDVLEKVSHYQHYCCQEMKSDTIYMSLERDPKPQMKFQLQAYETLRRGPS